MPAPIAALQEGTKTVSQFSLYSSAKNESPKNEKEGFSEIFQERLKSAPSLSGKEIRLSALERLLYDLRYRDPATWSYADRAHYHVEEKNQSFSRTVSQSPGGNGKSEDSLLKWLKFEISADSRRYGTSGDAASSPAAIQEQLAFQGRRRTPSQDFKTSLQEIARKERVSETQLIQEMVRKLALRNLKQGTEVEGTLHPALFGEISFRVLLKNNQVTVKFSTVNEAVAELFETHLGDLRAALLKQGLRVNPSDVEIFRKGGKTYAV